MHTAMRRLPRDKLSKPEVNSREVIKWTSDTAEIYLVHFSLKIWHLVPCGNNFNDFPESQLTKFQTFMLMFAEFRGAGAGSAP